MEDVTVVIPQRRQAALTRQAVQSLRSFEGEDCPVIVVDDGSGDDSANIILRASIANCRVWEQSARGVTAAWNAGIERVETEFVVLLNNDVIVEGPFLERLLFPLRTRQAWIAGAEWRIEPLAPMRRLLAGWCLAFEKTRWNELGGFDEAFRLYWSDTDFQCRAAAFASDREPLIAVPALPLRHLGHQTTRLDPQRTTWWHADRERFVRKWSRSPA